MTNDEMQRTLKKMQSRVEEILAELKRTKHSSDSSAKVELHARRAEKEAEELKHDLDTLRKKFPNT